MTGHFLQIDWVSHDKRVVHYNRKGESGIAKITSYLDDEGDEVDDFEDAAGFIIEINEHAFSYVSCAGLVPVTLN